MKTIVVLTGAGISAESGIQTFRDSNGLWENHDVMEVASPRGFENNPELVLEFYNQRRRQLKTVEPNAAHYSIAQLEENYQVFVVTQNIDDLHERAGSSNILHLHGELFKVRPVGKSEPVINWYEDLTLGDLSEDGIQLRPHIVWFGESVPNMDQAVQLVAQADLLVVVGTSLQVYPAAGLVDYAPQYTPIVVIDPNPNMDALEGDNIFTIQKTATEGMELLTSSLPSYFN